jgi:hypothetical protein
MICTDLAEVCGGSQIDRVCGANFETWQAEGSLNDGGIPKVTKALEVNSWTLKSQ